nr:uncharacterized protein LOC128696920 [Cherax quadricarinatus]
MALEDQILFKGHGQPFFKCWKPDSVYSLAPDEGLKSYQLSYNIVRTVHIDDYLEIDNAKHMKSYPLTEHTHTHLLNKVPGLCGLWYGISVPNDGQNNWYGNVSFTVNLRSVLKKIRNFNIYFVEVVDYNTSSASRLLITTERYQLPLYNPRMWGGPWFSDGRGKDWFLTDARRYDGRWNLNGHKVELFFVIPDNLFGPLFDMSRIDPVNHSEANDGICKCKRFRSGKRWTECPYPLSKEETRELIGY